MNPDSQLLTVVLRKDNLNQQWGFRLQGGADFTTPLSVQSVTPGGVAERSGLRATDAVLQINGQSTDTLEHEEAKYLLMRAGELTLLVQRGAVRVWKPKVTPLSELRPGGPSSGSGPASQETNGDSEYRVSLAADKQEFTPIGSTHNRSARPFPGFGGGSAPAAPPTMAAPVPVHAQQHMSAQSGQQYGQQVDMGGQASPSYTGQGQVSQQYSQSAAPSAYSQQQQQQGRQEYGHPGLGSNMANLSIHGNPSEVSPSQPKIQPQQLLGPPAPASSQTPARLSPTFRAIQDAGGLDGPKVSARPVSPRYAVLQAFTESDDQRGRSESLQAPAASVRSVSPTLLLIQQEEGGKVKEQPAEMKVKQVEKPAAEQEAKEGEEIRYHGYMDHNKQSKAFKILKSELDQGHEPPSRPSGIRSVRAPTTKPPGERSQNSQYMTCKACETLIVGVFVKVSGEPLHPECFKCVDCGKNLKNHGHFNVNGKLYCDVHARTAAQPPAPDMYATPVYR